MLSFDELPYLTLNLVFSQLPVSCDVIVQVPFPTPRDDKTFISNLEKQEITFILGECAWL